MSLTNSANRYGSVAKAFHWAIAVGIIAMIPMGIVANNLPFETADQLAQKALLFSVHKTLGVALFALALARIGWTLSQPKPSPLHPERKAETFLAELVHWLLYGSLILVPLSGWVHHAATSGFAPIWGIGQNLPLVPKSETLAAIAAGLHIVFERVLALSILLHVAGALKHHVIDKDDTLRRMLPGRVEAGSHAGHRSPVTGFSAALLVWAAALGIGGAMGVYGHHDSAPTAIALEAVESDWQVQDGSLGLTISQFGSDVSGAFNDWTAEIAFTPTPGAGEKGAVTVTVNIASLTLGTVADQAMGADFFDAATFPTATFTGPILADEAGDLRIDGNLTIKDISAPFSLPFELEITEGTARMTSAAMLDRQTYAIGSQMTDESQLGFTVALEISLTADRSE